MPINFKQLLEALSTHKYGDWEVVRTNHIGDRTARASHMTDDDWHTFHKRVIHEIERRTREPVTNGEKGFHSRSKGTKVVMNVHRTPGKPGGQLRHITHLEKHMVFKKGTPEYRVESVDQIEYIEIE